MAGTASPISTPCPNPKYLLLNSSFSVTSPTCPAIRLATATSSSSHKRLLIKCSGNSPQERGASDSLKDALSGLVDQQVEQLLSREENRALLDGLEKASQRVQMAKRELAEIARQELEAEQLRNYVNQLETRASQIEESQREISEARALVEEAQRSLLRKADGDGGEERLESIKAALISALVGTIAGLPISLTQVTSNTQLILPTAITFVSCALFGVTFRYAVRRDLDNFQLKAGTSAAFAFVKGMAWILTRVQKESKRVEHLNLNGECTAHDAPNNRGVEVLIWFYRAGLGMLGRGPPLELNAGSFVSHVVDGAVYVSENLLIFTFAAVSLDFCFKIWLLSPFPMKTSD